MTRDTINDLICSLFYYRENQEDIFELNGILCDALEEFGWQEDANYLRKHEECHKIIVLKNLTKLKAKIRLTKPCEVCRGCGEIIKLLDPKDISTAYGTKPCDFCEQRGWVLKQNG